VGQRIKLLHTLVSIVLKALHSHELHWKEAILVPKVQNQIYLETPIRNINGPSTLATLSYLSNKVEVREALKLKLSLIVSFLPITFLLHAQWLKIKHRVNTNLLMRTLTLSFPH
jgi:hypothetical protein